MPSKFPFTTRRPQRPQYFRADQRYWPSQPTAAGNGIFGCRDGRLKSAQEPAGVTGDRKSRTKPAKSPTETAHFYSACKSAVWWDWMVERKGFEPRVRSFDRPCSADRTQSPAAVSQKREFFKY